MFFNSNHMQKKISFVKATLVSSGVAFLAATLLGFWGKTHLEDLVLTAISISMTLFFGIKRSLAFIVLGVTAIVFSKYNLDLEKNEKLIWVMAALIVIATNLVVHLLKMNFASKLKVYITDTERKEINYKLLKNWLDTFLKNSSFGVISLDHGEKITRVNPLVCKVLEYSEEELINQHIAFLISRESIQKLLDLKNNSREEKNLDNFEIEMNSKSGKVVRFLLSSYQPIEESTIFQEQILILVDITEYIEVKNRLAMLSYVVDQSPISIEVTNKNIKIEYVNKKFIETTGYEVEEILGQNPRIFNSGETPKESYQKMWQTLKKGEAWRGEFINRKKNGSKYIEEVVISPIFNERGELINYVAIKDDVTEKRTILKLVEDHRKKLIEQDEMFKKISNNIPGVIYIFQKDPNGHVHFPYSSSNIYNHLGETSEKLRIDGTAAFKYHHPEDLLQLFHSGEESEKNMSLWKMEYRINHPTRGLIWLSGVSLPEKQIDGSIIWYGYIQDVTEKVIQEQRISEQQKLLLTSNRLSSLGELAAGVAHEINNPLMILLNKIRILKRSIINQRIKNEEIEFEFDKLQQNTLRIGKIVDSLRYFYNEDSAEEKKLVKFSSVISDVSVLVKERLKLHNIEFKNDNTLDEDVYCNPGKIGQVFLNLFNNSISAIENSENKWIEIKSSIENEKLILKFIDSGSGIDKKFKEKLMQPFFTTKEVGKGMGLGLSISYGIIKQHQGNLFYDSENPNTCFVIELPLAHSLKKAA